jgi:SPP1 gp7 family putative phage head morphogenesis protein
MQKQIRLKGLNDWKLKFSRKFGQAIVLSNLLGRAHVRIEAKLDTNVQPKPSDQALFAAFEQSREAGAAAGAVLFQNVLGSINVPPTAAIDILRNKVPMTQAAWERLNAQARLGAWYIAGIESVDLIARAQRLLIEGLEQGLTTEQIIRNIREAYSSYGVTPENPSHIDTMVATNLMQAYNAGRISQMLDPAVVGALPFWVYRTMGDNRVRPAHRALQGFIARADDPFWRKYYPPNGFNCRCMVDAIGGEHAREVAGNQNFTAPAAGRIPTVNGQPAVPDPGFGGWPGGFWENLLRTGTPGGGN